MTGTLLGRCAASALMIAAAVAPGSAAAAPTGAPEVPADPVRPALTVPDPALSSALDGIVEASPADTCLRVEIDGEVLYGHSDDAALVPASNQKLLTAAVALDELGADHRFRTAIVASSAPVDGTVGDLTLVGGGDPVLSSAAYRSERQIPEDQPATSLDALVDEVVAAGVTTVSGRVTADESRFDTERYVPTWPERYREQDQLGLLSAATVNDGYEAVDGARRKAPDPALHAARSVTEMLRERGVTVRGEAGVATAPAGALEVAAIESPPLRDLVADMLRRSDNGTAELLAKELGHVTGRGSSTAGGAAALAAWATAHRIGGPGTAVLDGSGLDPGNRVTCPELIDVLDAAGGRDGIVGAALPVAGREGTLAARFVDTPAAGVLRAKTGRLNGVSSLAGYVDMPEGRKAAFAYIANGEPVGEQLMAVQELLGTVLATYLAPCRSGGPDALVAPVAGYLGLVGASGAMPTAFTVLPGDLVVLDALHRSTASLLDRCSAGRPGGSGPLLLAGLDG